MPRVKFTRRYNHTWPSRAMTDYPEGYEGTVKQEVADAAIEAGAAKLARRSRGDADYTAPKRRKRRAKRAVATPAATPESGVKGTSATPQAPAAPIADARGAADTLPPSGNSE